MGEIWQPPMQMTSPASLIGSGYGRRSQIDGCMLCFDNYRVLKLRFSENWLLLLGMRGPQLECSINHGSGKSLRSSTAKEKPRVKYRLNRLTDVSVSACMIAAPLPFSLRPTLTTPRYHTERKGFYIYPELQFMLNTLP